jgi:hypothetical protein
MYKKKEIIIVNSHNKTYCEKLKILRLYLEGPREVKGKYAKIYRVYRNICMGRKILNLDLTVAQNPLGAVSLGTRKLRNW